MTRSSKTTTIKDDQTLLAPIGVGFNITNNVIIDFEVVVATDLSPNGGTELVVDPGIVYTRLPVALGLRVASNISHPKNVGLIPLAHYGLVDFGAGNWFIEAAFPTFVEKGKGLEFKAVLHTGIGL
ncbi:MAG: hypothetical protein EXR75_09695 [Myxococcales bacterium]|nr:hypothetical protein [Myxococcales bacterium]